MKEEEGDPKEQNLTHNVSKDYGYFYLL